MGHGHTATNGDSQLNAVLDKLQWRCIGPHRGGRVVAVAGHPYEPLTFYFGACAGGVWKTTDGGTYWECISDGFFRTAAVGAIAVSDSDPNVIYVGTGETAIRGNVSHGDGVYKSVDGGKSWTNVGLRDTRHIGRIRIHPDNPNIVYVAALGHAFGPNEERGVFRSTDGGITWEKVLYNGDRAGAIDLSMDPNNPRVLFASTWEVQRYPWKLNSGGPGSGIFKSTDGGDTWTDITRNHGLPRGTLGKIGVAISPANPERVWALVEAKDGALFRSDNGGETWHRVCEDPKLRRRAWYYHHLYADPRDAETCWVLNLACWKSSDGGRTFDAVPTGHGDNHDLWIDPRNTQRMIEGNDGGAQVTFNGALSWSTLYNQPTAQFYHVTTDTRVPYRVYGSQQDNTALSLPSRSLVGAIGPTEWWIPGGGESGYIAVRPDNPNVVFGGAIGSGFGNGLLWRYNHDDRSERNITVWPEVVGMGEGADALKYRFQWTFPVTISPHDPNVLYVAGNRVFRSTDEGGSWEPISPDLTRDDKSKQLPSGGLTLDNTGAEAYDTVFAFVESPHQPGLFWAGTDDGLVHLSRDAGQHWENITPPDLPEWSWVSIIELSPFDAGTAYLAAWRYKLDDYRPYLYKTGDYGKTWTAITNGLPANDFTRVIRTDPERPGLLYAGTETGIYVSFDDGGHWQPMQGNLPVAPIYDLCRKDGELIAATHGRSFWILEDVTLLHQLHEDAHVGGEPRLFQPARTERYFTFEWFGEGGAGVNYGHAGPLVAGFVRKEKADGSTEVTFLDAGTNPPNGVPIRYYLPEKPEGDITLAILDTDGNEIRSFTSAKEKAPKDETSNGGESTSVREEQTLALGLEGQEGEAGEAAAEEEEAAESQEPTVPKEAGLNRFIWNLRYPDARAVKGDKSMGIFLMGAPAVPSRYQVRLTIGDQSWTQPFELVPNPMRPAGDDVPRVQFELLTRMNEKLNAAHDAVNQIRDLKEQVAGWERRLKGQEGGREILEATGAVKKALTSIEGELFTSETDTDLLYTAALKLSGRMAALKFAVEFSTEPPTRQAYEVYEDLARRIDEQLTRLQEVLERDLVALNERIRASQFPVIAPRPSEQEATLVVAAAVE
jgi:photosystem II stability/assembly factor-like uncharacterized protein